MTDQIKVAVHGSYFADNYGDTLLVKIMCDMAASIVGKENVYLAVPGNEGEQKAIGYPIVPKAARGSVTHLIYGGGGYLGERTNAFLDNLNWSVRNYRRHLAWRTDFAHAKKAIIGAGFGPISNRLLRREVRNLLLDSQVVLLRDKESLDYAETYGIHHPAIGMCVDIALSLPVRDIARKGIAVHADNLSQTELEVIFGCLASKFGKDAPIEVIFDNASSHTKAVMDKYEAAANSAGLKELLCRSYDRFDALVEKVAEYSLVVTSKLHVGITSIAQGGQVISVPAHQKTARLYRQLGISQFCIQRHDLSASTFQLAIRALEQFKPDRVVIESGIQKVSGAVSTFLAQ